MTDRFLPGNANLPIGEKPTANQNIGDFGSVSQGWNSRGYLPHFENLEKIQHVTFHLADSLPKEVIERLHKEIYALPLEKQDTELRIRIEEWMDAGHGSCVLGVSHIAKLVQKAFLFHDNQRYKLFAWVIMPNHVHVLFQPINNWAMAKIVASWKKHTAMGIMAYGRCANQEIGVPGKPIWHREYWDRFIRTDLHFKQVVEYIHQNPVKAGLVPKPNLWIWSSAGEANLPSGESDPQRKQPPNSPP